MDKSITDLTDRAKSTSLNNSSEILTGGNSHNNCSNSSSSSSPLAYVNGSMRRPTSMGGGNRGASLLDGSPTAASPGTQHHTAATTYGQVLRVVVNRDEKGYGMKVSGDKPVYVQSVKEGGAAEKAGLHADDKIIQVNGVDVMESTHTEVVALIRSSTQVVLTVQQKPRMMSSPSLHVRPIPIQSSTRITGPKPVDNEKLRQFHKERVQTIRLMLEEEQRYVDSLRSDLARCPGDEKKLVELTNAERNVATMQNQLQSIVGTGHNNANEPSYSPQKQTNSPFRLSSPPARGATLPFVNTNIGNDPIPSPGGAMTLPTKTGKTKRSRLPHSYSASFTISETEQTPPPPPLPKRNNKQQHKDSNINLANIKSIRSLSNSPARDLNTLFLDNEIYCNNRERNYFTSNAGATSAGSVMIQNVLYDDTPPPLPPRLPITSGYTGNNLESDAVNSISKQMTYPLVATCATLVNNYPSPSPSPSPHISPHTHHRTKSSPDPLGTAIPQAEATARRLIASESLNDLTTSNTSPTCPTSTGGDGSWDVNAATPPGTPPPPYPSPIAGKRQLRGSNRNSAGTEDGEFCHDDGELSPEISPLRGVGSSTSLLLTTNSPIVAATPNTVQQPIISMEDDEISDQEVMEDHGPFKSLSRLWEHTPHLSVFLNYVLSNSDPSSLLFYLLTDLYKEGSAKDMRKWAVEISTSFLVPGAPLRLSNVDENIAREVDEVMLKEYDKEEILRKIFWKARNRAKEELNEQLADFQQKRTAGLGSFFGPGDALLDEMSRDKAKEMKLYEKLLLTKLEPYLEEFDKETVNPRRFITASALATVITKVFGFRGTHTLHNILERCPMFVSKDKSLRTKLIGRYSRKLNVNGHHYIAQHYFSVINCSNCHQVLYGIGPQGYQCSVCLINVHRHCVKQYDDACPGPMNKKDRGIGKFMERIRPESKDSRRKPSAYFISMERERRLTEEKDNILVIDTFPGERPLGHPVSRSSSDKRPDAVTEEATRGTSDSHHESELDHDTHIHDNLHNVQRAKSSQPAINRSESYKEQSQKRRQIRERRKISDPNLSKSNDVDSDHQELSYHSGSSSNSSLSSTKSSESPQSTSLDTVPGGHGVHGHGGHHHTHSTVSSTSTHATATAWDSDVDVEPDPPDWQSSVSEEILARLHPEEKKRQEIINELFHTERSHVRNLRVLETVFYRPLLQNKCLPSDQVRLLFPNLEEMLEIHGAFNTAMKQRRKEEAVVGDIGELLLNMFDGQAGDTLKFAVAKFCARQHYALELLKEKRRKDPRLNSFLTDCESDKLCKRLQLKDIIPTGIQRLVKYPLLFESLLKCTERVLDSTMMDSLPSTSPNTNTTTSSVPQMGPTQLELTRIKRALERSKEILNYVNQAVKEAEDKARLQEMQKKLDKISFEKFEHPISVEFRNVDLTKHKLIHEGPLVWRLNKQNKLSVHVVLLEEVILLLQKQDEKFILKFYSCNSQIHSPIVKVSTVLVRHNATEKDSLYLVNTAQNGAQIYDLSAQSSIECKTWFKHISDAAEAYKSRERRSEVSTPEPDLTTSSSNDLSTSITTPGQSTNSQNGDVDKTSSDGGDAQSTADSESTSGISGGDSARNSSVIDEEQAPSTSDKTLTQTDSDNNNTTTMGAEGGGVGIGVSGVGVGIGIGIGGSKREALMRFATDDQPLIQPCEVLINVLPVHTAQPVVTPIEQVRRKDEAIRQALAEKEALVAEILHVPPEEYQTIVDMAGDVTSTIIDKEPTELVLAAVNQANLLSSMVSECLNITESDPVLATSSGNPSCASQTTPQKSFTSGTLPAIPSNRVQTIASTLNTQLTALLKVVKEREDERERMRRELHKLREQLHAMHESQTNVATQEAAACSSDTDIFHSAGDLANIEEDP